MNYNYEKILNKKISILIHGLNKQETYIGFLTEVGEDYLELNCNLGNNPNYTIDLVVIKKELVVSFWVYK